MQINCFAAAEIHGLSRLCKIFQIIMVILLETSELNQALNCHSMHSHVNAALLLI